MHADLLSITRTRAVRVDAGRVLRFRNSGYSFAVIVDLDFWIQSDCWISYPVFFVLVPQFTAL